MVGLTDGLWQMEQGWRVALVSAPTSARNL